MINFKKQIQKAPIEKAIDAILRHNYMINSIDEYGMTMLHHASLRYDGLPLVELLLYLGIDKEIENKWNQTALDRVYHSIKISFTHEVQCFLSLSFQAKMLIFFILLSSFELRTFTRILNIFLKSFLAF